MGIISNLFEQRAASFKVGQEPPDWFGRAIGAWDSWAGVNVTPELAMTYGAVFACVNVISQTLASLPLITYRRLARGRERAVDFPLYSILHDLPNPEMTSFDMRQALMGHVALRGNGFAEIVSDRGGRVRELWPLRPDRMRLGRNQAGKLEYIYTLPQSIGGGEKTFRMEQIWHIRGLTSSGLWGLSPVGQAMQTVALGLAMDEFGSRFFGNGAQPGFWLKHPQQLKEAAYERLKKSFEQRNSGLTNAHRIAILEEGMSVEKIGIAPDEAQFLESRKFQIREVARWFRMPPHMIQDLENATFTNIEHQGIEFVVHTVRPWAVNLEQSISRCLLLEDERKQYYAEHLVDGLLRGDTQSRYTAYQSAINTGWMVPNEAREKENLNPIDGLDEPRMQLSYTTVGGDEPKKDPQGAGSGVRDAGGRIEAFLPVLEDVLGRIGKREGQDWSAALKGSGDLAKWVDGYYGELESYAQRQLEPVFRAIGTFLGDSSANFSDYAEERALILTRKWQKEGRTAVQNGPDEAKNWANLAEKRARDEARMELARIQGQGVR